MVKVENVGIERRSGNTFCGWLQFSHQGTMHLVLWTAVPHPPNEIYIQIFPEDNGGKGEFLVRKAQKILLYEIISTLGNLRTDDANARSEPGV